MALFKDKPRTAQQKAQRAKTSLMIRAVALFYLVFFVIVPLFETDPEEAASFNPVLRYAIIAFFIIVTAIITVFTVLEYIRNNKAGRYKAEAYKDDEGVEGATEIAEEDSSDEETDDDGEEYEDDEEYDDDEYGDDDYGDDDDEDEDGGYKDDEDRVDD